eukprot:CAMPEP_0184274596 /NCGR_PEP_ID=MMETSP0977-20130417/45698_1 /TAXON_ID=483370 /ORGANISM="non described non described, Strain CCMP2097" /LENGTH=52 /DNA_ID=CAMNT_0026580477 /DNA_START=14 /DNA_END=168 /DNA_ORIENTATION=-
MATGIRGCASKPASPAVSRSATKATSVEACPATPTPSTDAAADISSSRCAAA